MRRSYVYSSLHTLRLIGYAREAYRIGLRQEAKHGRYTNNKSFQRAYSLLVDVVIENDVCLSPSKWDLIEGLMAGSANDVREAFHILGGFAHKAVDNARHVEHGNYTGRSR